MLPRALFLWLIPVLSLAYNPPAHEILSRMETTLRNSGPLVVDIVREAPDGSVILKRSLKIPAESRSDLAPEPEYAIPFSLFTLPKDEMMDDLGSLFTADVSVSLDRIRGSVCYYLDGGGERLWLRKIDFIPLKAEVLSSFGERITCFYLDFTALSERLSYPARVEVYRDGSILFVEQIVSPPADVDQP